MSAWDGPLWKGLVCVCVCVLGAHVRACMCVHRVLQMRLQKTCDGAKLEKVLCRHQGL